MQKFEIYFRLDSHRTRGNYLIATEKFQRMHVQNCFKNSRGKFVQMQPCNILQHCKGYFFILKLFIGEGFELLVPARKIG